MRVEIEGETSHRDLKLDLVVKGRLGAKALEIMLRRFFGDRVAQRRREEGMKARPHVYIRPPRKADDERRRPRVPVAQACAGLGPNVVRNQPLIERERE